MSERRNRLRIPLEAEVRLRFSAGSPSYRGQVKNINVGGILIAAEKGFAPGSVLELEVVSPASRVGRGKPLRATIRVLRTEGDGPPYEVAGEILEMDL